MSDRVPVGVLVSGRGTNLRALIMAADRPDFPGQIALVICNRRDAGAIAIAEAENVPCRVMPLSEFGGDAELRDLAIRDALRLAGVKLVVCAGYNRVLRDCVLEAFPDAILNVHPSLLPAFGGGMAAVEEALEHGVRITGCTVQLLEPGEPDGGPIVLQAPVPVMDGDTVELLRDRIHMSEWVLLPEAVKLWCEGRLKREGRTVRILPNAVTSGGR
jgi:phosphoribosylglycinamide formyltransferase-1